MNNEYAVKALLNYFGTGAIMTCLGVSNFVDVFTVQECLELSGKPDISTNAQILKYKGIYIFLHRILLKLVVDKCLLKHGNLPINWNKYITDI